MSKPRFTLLIPEPPLTVLPTLAQRIGVNEAIFVQQLHYWTQRTRPDAEGWVYKTIEDWLRELPWLSRRGFQRVTAHCREHKIVESRQPGGQDRTTHYRLLYEAEVLAHPMAPDWRVEGARSSSPTRQDDALIDGSETTTETTTEKSKRANPVSEIADEVVREVLRHLGDVADAKQAKALSEEAVLRACADFGDRDLVLEAGKFAHWWLHGDGATKSIKDVVRGFRNWLARARRAPGQPRSGGVGRGSPSPGEHPTDRAARELRRRINGDDEAAA